MGKKIKRDPLTKAEKLYRGLAIGLFCYTVACAGVGGVIFPKMTKDESKTMAVIMSVIFFVYFAYTAVQTFLAFNYYRRSDQFAGVGHGVVLVITDITIRVVLRFCLLVLVEGLDKS